MTRSPSPNSSADNQAAIRVIAVAVLIQMLALEPPLLDERLAAVVAIVPAALAGPNRESEADEAFASLVNWAKPEDRTP